MNAQHTPGPWTIRVNRTKYPDLNTYTVLGRNTTPDSFCSGKYFTVASELDSEADARLIAAAPELLAACKEAFRIAADNAELYQRYGNEAGASVYLLIVDTLREALIQAGGDRS